MMMVSKSAPGKSWHNGPARGAVASHFPGMWVTCLDPAVAQYAHAILRAFFLFLFFFARGLFGKAKAVTKPRHKCSRLVYVNRATGLTGQTSCAPRDGIDVIRSRADKQTYRDE